MPIPLGIKHLCSVKQSLLENDSTYKQTGFAQQRLRCLFQVRKKNARQNLVHPQTARVYGLVFNRPPKVH